MKKLICVLMFVVFALFAVSTASAFEVQKLYVEGTNQFEGNSLTGMDTLHEWNLEGVAKAHLIKTRIGTIGGTFIVGYTPDDALEDVRIAGEVYVVPFNIPYIEAGVRHGTQSVDGFDIGRGNTAFFRVGMGF